jgi:type I restriction enzyme R subunit
MNNKTPEEKSRAKIDKQLNNLGWESLGEFKTEDAVGEGATGYIGEYQTDDGPVDYGLIVEGNLFAILEAKKGSANVTGQFQQLQRYSKAVSTPHAVDDEIGLPIGFVGNGEIFCRYDFREYGVNPTTFSSFYTPDELKSLVRRDYNAAIKYFNQVGPRDVDPDLWDHQRDAVNGVKDSLQEGNPYSLIRITTGAGKTRCAMALSHQLLEGGFADSILYIPDSRQIANQARDDFTEYDPVGIDNTFSDNYITKDLQNNVPHRLQSANVIVTTLQKMYEIAQDDPSRLSAGRFDVIITDECHRSIYNSEGYGQVLDQIDAIEIGLTATPTKQTIQRFNDNRVVNYGYNEALVDEHVVPYEANQIKTKITMDGVEKDGEYYPARELGRKFSVPDTHRKAAEVIHSEIDSKTELILIFAASDAHATAIVHDLRQSGPFAKENSEFIQKITYNADKPDQTLTNFKDPYSPPYIAVTVEKIEAGIDIRPLENVVMLRPVKSPVLFNQMVGRGTRTYDDKEKFRLFDFVGVLDYFEYLPPFGTEEHERDRSPGGEQASTDQSDQEEFKIINEPDEVVLTERYFQLDDIEGKITGEEYKQQFKFDVKKNADEIDEILHSADSVVDAKERVLDTLAEESGHYVPLHVIQVFNNDLPYETSSDMSNAVLVLNVINTILYGYYPDFDDRLTYTKQQLSDEHELNEVEKEYLEAFVHVASPPNGISISQLRHPPLSTMGSVERANKNFSSMDLRTFVDKFRSLITNPIGSELQNPSIHHNHIAEEFNLSREELQELINALYSSEPSKQYQRFSELALHESIVGSNMSDTRKERKNIDPKDILAAAVSSITDPTIGMIYAAISISISNINNDEPLSRREAFGYSVIWMLADEQVKNEVSFKNTADTIVRVSGYVDDSYLLNISDPDEIISGLENKDIIVSEEGPNGIKLILKDKFNVDWDLQNYLSDDIPSDIFDE